MLRPGEALVLDRHRMARGRKGLVRLKGDDPVYAARAISPSLAGREVVLDARKTFGGPAGSYAWVLTRKRRKNIISAGAVGLGAWKGGGGWKALGGLAGKT